jgi:hypothetical protein
MDRQTARGFVSLKIGDPDQTRFTPAQYNAAIEEAEKVFSADTTTPVKKAQLELESVSDDEYRIAIPDDLLFLLVVRWKGKTLQPKSEVALLKEYPGKDFGEGSSLSDPGNERSDLKGDPVFYWVDEQNEQLSFFPYPPQEDIGEEATVYYVPIPAEISADGTELLAAYPLTAPYHQAIVNLASAWMCDYLEWTPAIAGKKAALLKDYEVEKDKVINIYKNIIDEPIQMKGGKAWSIGADSPGSENAFSS